MKKAISIFLAVLMVITALPLTAISSFALANGDFEYAVISEENKTCSITKYTGAATELEIPSTLDGYTVISIDDNAFEFCDSLESAVIPNSITTIGDWVFNGCTSLEKVTIPDSVTKIGNYAFFECRVLKNITIPDSVTTIGEGVFMYCLSLESIDVAPENTAYSSMGGVLFDKDRTRLMQYPIGSTRTVYIIPDSVTSIEYYAFEGCTFLKSIYASDANTAYSSDDGILFSKDKTELIMCPDGREADTYTIPDGVISIRSNAFDFCTLIKNITIPECVTQIGSLAFYGCTLLESINVADANTEYSSADGVLYNKDKTNLIQYPVGNTRKTYRTPDSVTRISYCAFYNCTSLESITIPDSVTYIGRDAFSGCTSLTDIYYTGTEAQWNEISIIFGNDFTNVSIHYNFDSNFEYSIISEDDKTCEITGYTGTATELIIPEEVDGYSVISIGWGLLKGNTSIESVTLPDSIIGICDAAFEDCTSLKSITIPDSVTEIGSDVFYNTAYYNDENNWENNVLYIGNHIFDAKETISGDCVVKDGTKSIANYAFEDCASLESITIPDSVTSIGYGVFEGCTSLENINVSEENTAYSSVDGVLFNKDKIELIQYPVGNTETKYAIPDTVIYICDFSFAHCTSLESITIPDSVTYIGGWAFENCASLKSITISDGVTYIDWGAFSDCESLTDVYYTGTKEQWNATEIDDYNECLTSAAIHCNYKGSDCSGWIQENGKWAYYENGKIVKNKWVKDSVTWCYVGADGYCVTNAWQKDSKGWCYLGEDGRMVTNKWVKDSVTWCYVGADGYCVTNDWKADSKGWCYLDANGRMMANYWLQWNGNWYYLDENGYMVTGTKVINGKTYKFTSNGVWIG